MPGAERGHGGADLPAKQEHLLNAPIPPRPAARRDRVYKDVYVTSQSTVFPKIDADPNNVFAVAAAAAAGTNNTLQTPALTFALYGPRDLMLRMPLTRPMTSAPPGAAGCMHKGVLCVLVPCALHVRMHLTFGPRAVAARPQSSRCRPVALTWRLSPKSAGRRQGA